MNTTALVYHGMVDFPIFGIPRKALDPQGTKSNPMTTSAFRRALTSVLMVTVLAVVFPACNKEKPTTVVITVKNADGSLAPGVAVRLFANPTVPLKPDLTRLLKEGTTKGNGTVEFDYSGLYEQGQAGFAVLDILAEKDTMYAEGIIKILEEETNEQTLILERMPD
jgi:hypothetical protein